MNLKRFGIAAGFLATFVVGVSLVAYGTGMITSTAEELVLPDQPADASILQGSFGETDFPVPESLEITGTNETPTTNPTDSWPLDQEVPAPITIGSTETEINNYLNYLDTQGDRLGDIADAKGAVADKEAALTAARASGNQNAIRQAEAGLGSAISNLNNLTAGGGASGTGTGKVAANAKAKTLKAIDPATPVTLKRFLQDNFLTLDKILTIGIPRLLIVFAGLITLIMFLINAFKFLVNSGNEQGVTAAKQGMLYTGVGFVIVIMAYAVVSLASSIFK